MKRLLLSGICAALTLLATSAQFGVAQAFVPGSPELAYWDLGTRDSARVVIVLHGGPAVAHDYLRPEWDQLASLGRVVFYDQRGCGKSGRASGYTWQDHVEDLRRLIAYVSPDQPVVLAGSSWGGMLSALYYTKYPEDVEAMILSGVPGLPPRQAETRFLPKLDTGIGANPGTLQGSDRIHNLLTRVDNGRAETERARMNELLAPRFVAECRDVRDATWVSLQAAPYVPLEGTAVPVLLFPDNRYGIDFPKAVEEPETTGRLRTIVGGGHDPWFEYPSAFFEAVKAFLLDVGAT